jgi:hypothetical protein
VIKESGIRLVGCVAHMGQIRSAYRMLVRGLEGKKPLWRSRFGWDGTLKWILKE